MTRPSPRLHAPGRRLVHAVGATFVAALATACAGGGVPRLAPSPELEAVASVPRELTEDQQALHALNRLAFGPRPGDVAAVRAMGVDRWIEQQLQPATIADTAVERLEAGFGLLAGTPGDLMDRSPPPAFARQQQARSGEVPTADDSARYREMQRTQGQMVAQLQAERIAHAARSERQLEAVLTEFWLNHFNVFIQKGPTMRHYLPQYERDVIRPHVFDHFRELLGAVAHSPAMLIYLDNALSIADSMHYTLAELRARGGPQGRFPARRRQGLNENYGRELLELHTLGVDGGYTQADVINVARAFTGWSVEQPRQGGGFVFRPGAHDADPKVVLGHLLQGGRGVEDGEEVLDIVARHPSTARFIARKLCVRLVSDAPPEALVERAAATFTRTDGDLREVVRTIVMSPEFFARAAWRAKVKSPFEVVVSAARALGAAADTTPRTAAAVALLGQPLWGHMAPNGWPDAARDWMNTGAILARINFGFAVGANRL
ncbi:MAG: DUF1800 domain-containing protein, partial [Gemmatimonadetes bacterium]|nr:DUF1800 domain-containing protein [Gemmatimonadota bacterium]